MTAGVMTDVRGEIRMNNIIKCIAEFLGAETHEPVGLCSFERGKTREKSVRRILKRKKEMRLSELME